MIVIGCDCTAIDIGGNGTVALVSISTDEGMVAMTEGGSATAADGTTTVSTTTCGSTTDTFPSSTPLAARGEGRFSLVQGTGSGCLFLPGYFARNSFALSRFFSISLKNARSPLRILRSPLLGGCSMMTRIDARYV